VIDDEPNQVVLELADVISMQRHQASSRSKAKASAIDIELCRARSDEALVSDRHDERPCVGARVVPEEGSSMKVCTERAAHESARLPRQRNSHPHQATEEGPGDRAAERSHDLLPAAPLVLDSVCSVEARYQLRVGFSPYSTGVAVLNPSKWTSDRAISVAILPLLYEAWQARQRVPRPLLGSRPVRGQPSRFRP
jgi:hypothetical protein